MIANTLDDAQKDERQVKLIDMENEQKPPSDKSLVDSLEDDIVDDTRSEQYIEDSFADNGEIYDQR